MQITSLASKSVVDPTYPPEAHRRPPVFPPACACAWGDDRHGLWIDVEIQSVVQRFRWIEPGEFVMGAPETELERQDNEGPQHVVRLTEGWWLADTPCSQALWQAVMGRNPSRFGDDAQNPVNQVSWDDVQGFLKRLEGLLAGVKADLLTEAEWEYACCAGTQRVFSFGSAPKPPQTSGNVTYSGGATGEYRKKTLPVKSVAPNPWGLYQMHGNVWEWCADGLRTYDGEAQIDPRGPEGDAPRALRGVSSHNVQTRFRATRRGQSERDGRGSYTGFRFSLRPLPEVGLMRAA